MAIERSSRGLPKLKKEVLPPQKPNNGIGVMLVAATAMFFAVASSAFILRARMAREGCPAMERNHGTTMSIHSLDETVVPTPPPPPSVVAPDRARVWNVPYPATQQVVPNVLIAPAAPKAPKAPAKVKPIVHDVVNPF